MRKSKQFLVYKNCAISYNQTGEKHMTLAEKLTQARKAAGLTQADSAEKLNVSRQAVSLWESGQSRPSTDKLSALAKIYTVSLDWLCSGTDEPVPDKLTAYTCPESEPAEQGKQWKKSIAKWAAIVLALFALIAAIFIWTHTGSQDNCIPIDDIQRRVVEPNAAPEFDLEW